MIFQGIKWVGIAAWSFALGYMVVSLVERLRPMSPPMAHFGFYTGATATLFFLILHSAFGEPLGDGTDKPSRFPHEEEPLVGCPTCHGEMHLLGANVRQGRTALYLWTCERDHGWSRQGDSPADDTYPWQPCNPAEMMGVFFG